MPTVLILDGQTNQALACTRSLGRAGYHVIVASRFRWPLAAASRYCRAKVRLGSETLEDYTCLRQQLSGAGIDFVLPLTELSCVLCDFERSAWEHVGARIACAGSEILQQAFDKAATVATAVRVGVAVPTTCVPRSIEEARRAAAETGYPCVIKPRFSHYWDGAGFLPNLACAYVERPDDLEAAILSRRQGANWPLMQPYVAGTGKGVFALCDRGKAVAWFAHERLRDVRPTGSGSSLRRSIPLDARLKEPAERLLMDLAWHGPAMVEFRDDGVNPPWLMEVNGRFWNSLELAIQAGVDFPRLWLEILGGRPVRPLEHYEHGVTLRWLWGDVKHLLYVAAGRPRGFTGDFPTFFDGVSEVLGRQPPGTRLEIWQRDDPWPAIAEWTQAAQDVAELAWKKGAERLGRSRANAPSRPTTNEPSLVE
jgi:predicted ATP-grasp superfamily ATP-dependent carboligase